MTKNLKTFDFTLTLQIVATDEDEAYAIFQRELDEGTFDPDLKDADAYEVDEGDELIDLEDWN